MPDKAMTNNDEHRIGPEELFSRLAAAPRGLAHAEAAERLRQYGPNTFEARERVPLYRRFGKHLFNFFAILLWTGALLAFASERLSPGMGSLYIGIAIAGVVVINAVFAFIQEYESERIIESFRKMMPDTIDALRDGVRQTIPAESVLPGDIIFLEEGDRVPADARLIEENTLKVDHSSLTGESEPKLRKLECTHENILESRNMVFSGTTVQSGNGKALVYATGMSSHIGRVASLTKRTEAISSPLRRELNHFIRIISIIAITLGTVFFGISILSGDTLLAGMIFAIGIIVANVPEGLLPTVTLSLSMASERMAKRKALVKRLESVETLGSATVICTDKTGTITENRISVNTLFIGMEERNVHEKGIEGLPGLEPLIKTAVLCNNTRLVNGEYHGDPTEVALMRFAEKHADVSRIIRENRRIKESPFDSVKRRMLTVNETPDGQAAFLKGAPEVILAKCARAMRDHGTADLDDELKARVMGRYERMASRGERVLALAYSEKFLESEGGFVFIGLAGMIDPPRKEIPEAISRCKAAGIRVIMITGDNSVTAEAIARIAGMIDRHRQPEIMTGDELERCDEERLKEFLKGENIIFARTSPMQKLRIVKALQSMGEVVAVTGDGVNDAPALKHADMGVAMGLSGTEVAQEAADMVLLDDNFATIVNAIEEGRTVFSNIRKFIQYILTSNVPEIMPFIAFVILGLPLPLTVLLILAIDLGTDLLPALGLGKETPEDDVMKLPPRPRTERLLSPRLLFMSYGLYGMIQAAAGFYSYFSVLYAGGWTWGEALSPTSALYMKAVTAFFVSIVVCQMANVMICRTRRESVFKKGLLSNRLVLLGIVAEVALLWIIVYNPVAQKVFGTYPLGVSELLLALPFAALILFGDEARKLLLRRGNLFIARRLSW